MNDRAQHLTMLPAASSHPRPIVTRAAFSLSAGAELLDEYLRLHPKDRGSWSASEAARIAAAEKALDALGRESAEAPARMAEALHELGLRKTDDLQSFLPDEPFPVLGSYPAPDTAVEELGRLYLATSPKGRLAFLPSVVCRVVSTERREYRLDQIAVAPNWAEREGQYRLRGLWTPDKQYDVLRIETNDSAWKRDFWFSVVDDLGIERSVFWRHAILKERAWHTQPRSVEST